MADLGRGVAKHRSPDGPDAAFLSLDPEDDPLGGAAVVDAVEDALGVPPRGSAVLHGARIDHGYNRLVERLSAFLRNPFSFLFASKSGAERVAMYVVREHRRGRSLSDILDDPYVRNRCSEREIARVLERPEVVHALGEDIVAEHRQALDGHS